MRLAFRDRHHALDQSQTLEGVEIGTDAAQAGGLLDLVEPRATRSDGLQDSKIVARFAQLLLKQEAHFVVEKGAPRQHLPVQVGQQRLRRRQRAQIGRGAAEDGVGAHLIGQVVVRKKALRLVKAERLQQVLAGTPAIERGLVSQHRLFHHTHVGAAQDQHQLAVHQLFIPHALQR